MVEGRGVWMLRGDPQGDGESVIRVGQGEVLDRYVDKAACLAPLGDLFIGKAEPVVGVVGTHLLVLVRTEVHDEQPATGAKASSSFVNRSSWIVEKVQHVVKYGDIERAAVDPEVIGIGLADRAVPVTQLVEPAASEVEHLIAEVEAHSSPDPVGEDFEHSTRAGTNVEQLVDIEVSDSAQHGLLDLIIGDMAGTHAIPISSDSLEVLGCNFGPLCPDSRQPTQVALEARIVVVDQRQKRIKQLSAWPGSSWPIERACALGMALENARLAQQPQVTTDPGLGLPKDSAQLTNGEFAARQNRKDAEPC